MFHQSRNKLRVLYRGQAFVKRLLRQLIPWTTTERQIGLQAGHKPGRSWNGNGVDVHTLIAHSHDQFFNLVTVAVGSTGAVAEQHPRLTGFFADP